MNIILCGIVLNEADNIVRTLDSFKPVADKVILTDTGSTDGTPELIEAWLRENQVPGVVYRTPWSELAAAQGLPLRADGSPALFDFARARNTAVSLAMQHADRSGDDRDWIFEVDSNWELQGPVHRLRPALEQAPAELTAYNIAVHETGAASTDYLRLRRVRECGPRGWYWHFPIHEYIYRFDNAVVGKIEGLYAVHDASPGSLANRKKRVERDAVILRELIDDYTARGLESRAAGDYERGLLTRAWYFLGQTYSVMDRHDEAYDAFAERARLQGAVVEWADACYRAGRILASQKEWLRAARWFLEAYAVGGRPEGLWGYAEVSRAAGESAVSSAAALVAYDVAKASQDSPAGGFARTEALALATPGPARDQATIAARIKQLGLLGVPYPGERD